MTDNAIQNWGSVQSPYSLEAEQATIGAVLVNPAMFATISAFLKPDDFFMLRHRYIWQALGELAEAKVPIDYLTIGNHLKGQNRWMEIGGDAYLTELINSTPTSVHGEVYGRLVQSFAGRRNLLRVADEIKANALDTSIPYEKVESEAVRIVTQTQQASTSDLVPMRVSVPLHMDMVERAVNRENPSELLGLPSCLDELNKILHGYQKKKLYVGCGRPGMGKTSHLINEAAFLASLGMRIAFFTLEMSREEVVNSIFMSEIEVDSYSIQSGKIEKMGLYPKYLAATKRIAEWKLFIDDTGSITASALRAKCLKLAYEHGLDMVFVDYLQLMGSDGYHELRTYEVGANSHALKDMAKEMNIPVFTAAQLNRGVDDRQDKHPQLSDLRESGNIEQDADAVLAYYRDDYYFPQPKPEDDSIVVLSNVDIGVLKHRDGDTGIVNAGFKGKFKKFVNQVPESINERVIINQNGKGVK